MRPIKRRPINLSFKRRPPSKWCALKIMNKKKANPIICTFPQSEFAYDGCNCILAIHRIDQFKKRDILH